VGDEVVRSGHEESPFAVETSGPEWQDLTQPTSLTSGEWFFKLVSQLLRAYRLKATAGHLREKYPNYSTDDLVSKAIDVSARTAAFTGAAAGLVT
jgi:hypothetical protein